MNSGKVEMLLVLNTNPVYDAPPDLGFLDALNKVAVARAYRALSG